MTADALLAELQRRGVELVAAGDRLQFRPAAAVPPELLETLRHHKDEVLALLSAEASPTRPVKPPDSERDATHRDPDVAAALAQIEVEIASGRIGKGPILIRGKPLADYLSLDELARLLRRARR